MENSPSSNSTSNHNQSNSNGNEQPVEMPNKENGTNNGHNPPATAEELFNIPPQQQQMMPASTEQLNMRCTGVKRLLKEAMELREPNELFCAKPMEDNLFEWHFTVRGPPDTVYADGLYHGRIVLPADYPMKPPNLILLTPNGRFETNKKICLSISGYHPETWLPSWSIRTALLALIGFMPSHSAGALGGLECSKEERRRLAIKSQDWCCPQCGIRMCDALPALGSIGNAEKLMGEVKNASESPTSQQQKVQTAGISSQSTNQLEQGNNVHSTPLSSIPTTPELTTTPANAQQQTATHPQQTSNAINAQTATPVNATATQQPSTNSSSLLENPLIWIFVLSTLLFALLLRRLLLNYAATQMEGDGRNE